MDINIAYREKMNLVVAGNYRTFPITWQRVSKVIYHVFLPSIFFKQYAFKYLYAISLLLGCLIFFVRTRCCNALSLSYHSNTEAVLLAFVTKIVSNKVYVSVCVCVYFNSLKWLSLYFNNIVRFL